MAQPQDRTLDTAARCAPWRMAWALARASPPTRHSGMALAPDPAAKPCPVPGSRWNWPPAAPWVVAARAPKRMRPPAASIRARFHRVAAPPAPVRVSRRRMCGHHGRKRQVEQTRTVRHANLEAQTEGLLGDGHDYGLLVCIWRRSKLKLSPTGCQAAVIPGKRSPPRCPESTPRCRSIPHGAVPAIPAQQRSTTEAPEQDPAAAPKARPAAPGARMPHS